MRIAITGATGFLGRYLLRSGLENRHEIRAWYRSSTRDRVMSPAIEWVRGELGNEADARALVDSADVVIHAGLSRRGASFLDSGDEPLEYWQQNATGSLQLLEAAREAGVSRFIFISSGAVHDEVVPDRPLDETHPLLPNTLYGAYKASVETLVHHYGRSRGICATTLRPPAIYGVAEPPRQSKWFDLIRDVCRGKTVEATGGSKVVHAGDIAKAAMLLVETDVDRINGETFNCCDRMISDHEVATIAKEISGSDADIRGAAKTAKHQIETGKLRSLGMSFGGDALLRATITELIAAAEE